jgi:hypothetical protein
MFCQLSQYVVKRFCLSDTFFFWELYFVIQVTSLNQEIVRALARGTLVITYPVIHNEIREQFLFFMHCYTSYW